MLSGKKSLESRWEECVEIVFESLPIATSALYVKNFFKKESRNAAIEMVESLKDEFLNILKSVPWMDETTREFALEKAKKMVAHIGFPDELMDNLKVNEYYESLNVDENHYFGSIVNVSKFDCAKALKTLRLPVNKTDWETHASVALVNAFYNGQENSIRKC